MCMQAQFLDLNVATFYLLIFFKFIMSFLLISHLFDFTGSTNTSSSQVDLFGQSFMGDLMDEPVSLPTETTTHSNPATTEVDLFADATFQSASPQAGVTATSHSQVSLNIFPNYKGG